MLCLLLAVLVSAGDLPDRIAKLLDEFEEKRVQRGDYVAVDSAEPAVDDEEEADYVEPEDDSHDRQAAIYNPDKEGRFALKRGGLAKGDGLSEKGFQGTSRGARGGATGVPEGAEGGLAYDWDVRNWFKNDGEPNPGKGAFPDWRLKFNYWDAKVTALGERSYWQKQAGLEIGDNRSPSLQPAPATLSPFEMWSGSPQPATHGHYLLTASQRYKGIEDKWGGWAEYGDCQNWRLDYPHRHDYGPESSDSSVRQYWRDLGEINTDHNFCRNPDNSPGGTWCYTTESNKRWRYCGFQYGNRCYGLEGNYGPGAPTGSDIWKNQGEVCGGRMLLEQREDDGMLIRRLEE